QGRRLIEAIGSPAPSDHPEALVHQLECSYGGCDWLLDRWAELRAVLERGELWKPETTLLAVTLLGKAGAPQDYQLVKSMSGKDDPQAQLTRRQVADSYLDQPMPADPASRQALLGALIEQTTARLQGLLADHQERLDADAATLDDLLGFDPSADAE